MYLVTREYIKWPHRDYDPINDTMSSQKLWSVYLGLVVAHYVAFDIKHVMVPIKPSVDTSINVKKIDHSRCKCHYYSYWKWIYNRVIYKGTWRLNKIP